MRLHNINSVEYNTKQMIINPQCLTLICKSLITLQGIGGESY